jgi:hypothetical protein
MNIELDPTKRAIVTKEAKKTLLPEQRSINVARKLLIREINRQLENLLKYKPKEFRLFIENNPILKEIVETDFRNGEKIKTSIDKFTDGELFEKVKFAEDHIKDFNKTKINALGEVLVGAGIENPENLRITLRHLNSPLKSKVIEFVERNSGSQNIKIQNQIKDWKSFFNRTGQAFLTGEFEKGTIEGRTGNISLKQQFKNLGLDVIKILDASGNEKLKAKILKVVGEDSIVGLKNKLNTNPQETLLKIVEKAPEIQNSISTKSWNALKSVGKWGLLRPIAITAIPAVAAKEGLMEIWDAVKEKRLPNLPDFSNPMTWMTPAFWHWASNAWGFDKTLEYFGKTFKDLSKGNKARLIRNVVTNAGLKPHQLLKIRDFSVPWLAATVIGKSFTESETGAFRKDGENIFKGMETQVLPSMIKDYHKKYESDEFFEKEYGMKKEDYKSELAERYRKDPDDLKAIAQRNRNVPSLSKQIKNWIFKKEYSDYTKDKDDLAMGGIASLIK